ncbi:MAG: PAS domain S-box protein, partial [Methanoregula sp.]
MTEISVLYVDDEPALLELAPIYLKRSGLLSITTLDSAQKALELLKTETFDAIVSDYQMPVMDGIEFLKEIRKKYDHIPFILFTGKGREEVVVEAFNSGADAYLQKGGKPVAQFVELEQKIKVNVNNCRSQKALCESEKKYRQLVENAQEGIIIIQDEKITFSNPKFCEIITNGGYTIKDFFSEPYFTFIHPDDRPVLRDRYVRRITNSEKFPRYSFRVVSKTGATFWWEVDAIKISWNGGPATLNFLRDITVECHLRELVKESENRYRELVESLPKTVIELDKQFNVTFMNRAGREKWGFESEPLGRPVFDLLHIDDRNRIREMYQGALNANLPPAHETTALMCNGSTFPLVTFVTA